jgi:hypothetical protein
MENVLTKFSLQFRKKNLGKKYEKARWKILQKASFKGLIFAFIVIGINTIGLYFRGKYTGTNSTYHIFATSFIVFAISLEVVVRKFYILRYFSFSVLVITIFIHAIEMNIRIFETQFFHPW